MKRKTFFQSTSGGIRAAKMAIRVKIQSAISNRQAFFRVMHPPRIVLGTVYHKLFFFQGAAVLYKHSSRLPSPQRQPYSAEHNNQRGDAEHDAVFYGVLGALRGEGEGSSAYGF